MILSVVLSENIKKLGCTDLRSIQCKELLLELKQDILDLLAYTMYNIHLGVVHSILTDNLKSINNSMF